jgi:hypothetical protein
LGLAFSEKEVAFPGDIRGAITNHNRNVENGRKTNNG